MSLTFRTGSNGKGSALTIEELDNNFRYFAGTHAITGSLTVSGSLTGTSTVLLTGLPTSSTGLDTGSLWLSGSNGDGSSYLMVVNP